jgi:hypothetical protein
MVLNALNGFVHVDEFTGPRLTFSNFRREFASTLFANRTSQKVITATGIQFPQATIKGSFIVYLTQAIPSYFDNQYFIANVRTLHIMSATSPLLQGF